MKLWFVLLNGASRKLKLSAPFSVFFTLSFPYVGLIVTTTGPHQLTHMPIHSHIFTLSYTHSHHLRIPSHTTQSTPHYLLPPVQAHSDCLCVHPPGLQVVQLGDPSFYWWETLVGVCGQLCHSRAAWWWVEMDISFDMRFIELTFNIFCIYLLL